MPTTISPESSPVIGSLEMICSGDSLSKREVHYCYPHRPAGPERCEFRGVRYLPRVWERSPREPSAEHICAQCISRIKPKGRDPASHAARKMLWWYGLRLSS